MIEDVAALRRDIQRLRSENSRLARLLEIQGQDTTPAAEQSAIGAVPEGPLTMRSRVEDKLALYETLFRSRRDVYAIRWDNRWSGKSGWMPAVAGGWRKGMSRKSARQLPLTSEVLAAHLTGDVFVGLYPLMPDSTCHFLAADFDGQSALLDALAYTKAARSMGAPAAVELSQSGRGAHVWVFFQEPVPAESARAMGTALVHEATVLRGAMDLRSYDRLFPNQDTMPAGGFGNLIAAPLQGLRRKEGLTCFLDPATLEPFEDQWLYLSTVDRLAAHQVRQLARQADRTRVGVHVTEVTRSTATRVHPQPPPVVHAELGAGFTIKSEDLTAATAATIKHASSIVNPKFYELQRLRKSTWDTPRFVRGYDLTLDDDLVLPRGLRHRIVALVEDAGSRLTFTDVRNAGSEIDITCNAVLSDVQLRAVGAMLAHDDGILVAPPGSGKTVMAAAVIAERATSTLILVDRKALADQWRDRITRFMGVRPGQLGGGRRKLTGMIDIAMLPTIGRRDDVAELTAPYGQIVVDECHHLGAASYDHAVKKIGAQFWLGLTATPERRDGLSELINWQLGPVRHTLETSEPGTIEAAVADVVGHREVRLQNTSFRYGDVDVTQPAALAAVHRAMADDDDRNAQIVGDIDAALRNNRNCLVLTRRIAQLERFSRLLTELGHRPFVLQGAMSASDRRSVMRDFEEVRPGDGALLIGTTPFIGEGFDAPALDTLFLAAPISFDGLLVQCAGRILRACPGKGDALVYDYHDAETPFLAASLKRRMPGYRALGFAVSEQGGS